VGADGGTILLLGKGCLAAIVQVQYAGGGASMQAQLPALQFLSIAWQSAPSKTPSHEHD
jgi:hypothetical protein